MPQTRTRHFSWLASTALLALACATPAHAAALRVVSTFSIISDLAKNVGGDRIALTTLVGPNGDIHTYEPRPADLKALGTAEVILSNGLQLEGFLPGLVQASGAQVPVTALTDGITLRLTDPEPHDHEPAHEDHDDHDDGHHHHGKYDPHAWQSVPNAQIYVKNIAQAFCAADAQGCDGYQARAQAYGAQLAALQTEIQTLFAEVPADRRKIITPHDAFGYFGQTYGFTFTAPQGMGTDSEASASGVATLIRQVKTEQAAALFLENVSNPRIVEQIAQETGVQVSGKLYSDALSGPDAPASTYIDMMRHNATAIHDAVLGR